MDENILPGRIDSREMGLADFLDSAHPDLFYKTSAFARFMEDVRARGHDTYVRHVSRYEGGSATIDGEDRSSQQRVVMMCSADYLGLTRHPQVLAAAQKAIDQYGASVCSVPLIAGATALHSELETMLARFIGTEACVLFPTGQAANQGLIQALCTYRDTIVLDKLVHYSILDGVRLSGARWRTFRHSDPDHLTRVLETVRSKQKDSGILVVVEGVYGIDGDVPPLRELLDVCNRFGARVMVDEAHATGILGKRGRGSMEAHEIQDKSLIIMGSLSKSLGSFGGFIAAPAEIVDYLRYAARTIAFSVGLPASCVGGAMAGLDILQDHSNVLARFRANRDFFQKGLEKFGVTNAQKSGSAIFSAPVGNDRKLREIARELFRRGVYAEALGFPAVPHGQERVRFRVSATHTQEELARVLQIVEAVFSEQHVITSSPPVPGLPVCHSGNGDDTGIVELARKEATIRGYPVSWFRSNHSEGETEIFRQFFTGGTDGWQAAVYAKLEPEISKQEGITVGTLGQIRWLPGSEPALTGLLQKALQWLIEKGAHTILAPVQSPLLLWGGGIAALESPSVFPMLQPYVAPVLAEMLKKLGFQPDICLPHSRINLAKANAALALPQNSKIFVRPLNKMRLREEIAIIYPLINASLSRLKYCGALRAEDLYAAAHDLRELIIGDFWRIAEIDGTPAGFVGAIPDVNETLIQTGGIAGTADIEKLELAFAATRRASIVWLGVSDNFQEAGVGQALLKDIYDALLKRNFNEAWLHWEFVDGKLGIKDFLPPELAIEEHLNYSIFKWTA